VLLHGNPAVDIFNGLKLASGGELGYGVGEEEWGSGEREVLEDLTRRTEGLEDVLVSRFGDPIPVQDEKRPQDDEGPPWMGSAVQPAATDGLIFSGVGSMERHSIRDVSLWMRQIYSYGEYAFGVRDNPLRERRKRKRRNVEHLRPSNGAAVRPQSRSPERGNSGQPQNGSRSEETEHEEERNELQVPEDTRPDIHPRVTTQDYTITPDGTQTPPVEDSRPTIPPPIVTATERALENATKHVDKASENGQDAIESAEESSTTLGIPDQYMKYLTFGLSTLSKTTIKRPSASRQSSASVNIQSSRPQKQEDKPGIFKLPERDVDPTMTRMEPMPDGETLRTRIATQIQQENKGHFLIGLRGDLDSPKEDEDADFTDGSFHKDPDGSRIVLRTIQVQTVDKPTDDDEDRRNSVSALQSSDHPMKNYQRLRVLIYVHRPFIYCFLFRNRTSSLQYTEFYRSLHQILSPIRKALLSSTDVAKIAQRIEESHVDSTTTEESDRASESGRNTLPSKGTSTTPIYDVIYDPRLMTVHASIPNIPMPGTPAAEGILTSLRGSDSTAPPSWTRLEALNVHSQILNTLQSVRSRKHEIERASKTSRGWWVVWMKVPPSSPAAASGEGEADTQITADSQASLRSDQHVEISGEDMTVEAVPEAQPDMHRIAFLVRKASDVATTANSTSASSRAMSSLFSNMSLGLGSRNDDATGGANAGWGPAGLTGGIGIDARRYVEGLLSLNR
jgi:hypothetical protein